MSDFLERNLSEDVIQKIANHCSFKAMKVNQMSNFQLVPKELMDSNISPFLRKGELFAFSPSVDPASCLSALCQVFFFKTVFFCFCFLIDLKSESLCPCSHLRCCWRLEKPFHSGTTTEGHISPAERAAEWERHSALEFGVTNIYPKQLNDSL